MHHDLFGNSILMRSAGQGGADLGDTIDQSLRFSASNLDFNILHQHLVTDEHGRGIQVKRGLIDSTCGLLGVSAGASDAQQTEIRFESNGMLSLRGWTTLFRQTAMQFRDPNAWYHIVVVCDITNSTANDRIRFFINGQKVTDWDSISNPGTSDIFAINYADNTRLGLRANGSDPLQGYLAETYFIDGTAISDTGGVIDEFGKYNDDGVWVPQNYTGSFGPNNGYHLSMIRLVSTDLAVIVPITAAAVTTLPQMVTPLQSAAATLIMILTTKTRRRVIMQPLILL